MDLLDKYLPRREFSSYEDFKANYTVNVPENFNFGFDIIDEYARLTPDKLALVHTDESFNITKYTFDDISRMSNRVANMFAAAGIGKGDTVMMMLRERPEAWITIVALCKLGAVSIPATFQLTPKDIIYRCDAAKVKAVCFAEDADILGHLRTCRDKCSTLKEIFIVGDGMTAKYGDEFIDYRSKETDYSDVFERPSGNRAVSNDDIMLTYFSSGTTGMPKMVAHTFSYPLGHITTAKYWQQVEDDGLHLTMSDSGWAKFAWGKIFGQWIAGTALVAFDTGKFDPAKLRRAIHELGVTTFCAPPTIYRFLIKESLGHDDFATVHHCCTAGEPLYPEVFNRFKEITGLTIYEGFGQTETSVLIANFGWDEIKPGSTGKPSPLYDIDILDDEGNRCEDGIVGHIIVKNAGTPGECGYSTTRPVGLFREYRSDPEAMEKAWYNGGYDTGDMAWRDSDGYLRFEGRSDDVIKCSGYRIGPFEVESALLTHPAVLECAVTAAPDPIRGQVVRASVVLMKGFEPTDALRKELQNHVKVTTAPYKYPRILDFVESLPKTISDKIKRAEIRQKYTESQNQKKN